MNVKIREAIENDYCQICSLINNELGYPDVIIDDLTMQMKKMDQDENYKTFVALLDDVIVGFVGTVQGIAFEVDSGYMRVIALAVSIDYQNKGVGTSLLKHVENFASSKEITNVALNSGFRRLEAHAFYENNGYSKKSYGFSKDIMSLA